MGFVRPQIWALPALLFLAPVVDAEVIFDNGFALDNAIRCSDITQCADNFFVFPGANVITEVQWWGIYSPNASGSTAVDDFEIRIYSDQSGLPTPPGTHVYQALVGSVTRVDTGLDMGDGEDVYEYHATIPPFVATPGLLYWFEVFNELDTPSTGIRWYWLVTVDFVTGNCASTGIDSTWQNLTAETAFLLVPEPSNRLLLAAGILGLAALGRRRHRQAAPERIGIPSPVSRLTS